MLRFVIALLSGLFIMQCRTGRPALDISALPNYDKSSPDHILFLQFRISGEAGGKERVELVSANVANGRMKEMDSPVIFPVYLKAIPRYTTSAIEREMLFENPLRRAVEISDPSGYIRRQEVREQEGSLFIRMPVHGGLNGLELFSVSPERGEVQIYHLQFKQP